MMLTWHTHQCYVEPPNAVLHSTATTGQNVTAWVSLSIFGTSLVSYLFSSYVAYIMNLEGQISTYQIYSQSLQLTVKGKEALLNLHTTHGLEQVSHNGKCSH